MAIAPLTHLVWAQTLATTIEFIACFHNFILLLYHIYSVYKNAGKPKKIASIQYLCIAIIAIYLPYCIGVILISYGVHPSFIDCTIWLDCVGALFFVAKNSFLILFLEKLYVSFAETIYALNSRTIAIARAIICIWCMIEIAILFISSRNYDVDEHDICAASYPLWAHAVCILGDVTIGVTISIVFCRRLMKMTVTLQTLDEKSNSAVDIIARNQEITNVASKITVLATFSIISTLCVYIFVFIFELVSFWVMIDSIINCWAAVLLFKVHQRLFAMLCGGVQTCCIKSGCISCCSCQCCCMIKPSAVNIYEEEKGGIDKETEKQMENHNEKPDDIEITTQNK